MYNNTFLIGRLVRDPEYRLTSSGIAVCRFTIAVNKIKSDEADFLRIVAWRRLAEICSQYLKKGKLIAIEGRLQIESYVKDWKVADIGEIELKAGKALMRLMALEKPGNTVMDFRLMLFERVE